MIMMLVTINQMGLPKGVPGESRDDIVLNPYPDPDPDRYVILQNITTAGITDWKWEILDKPTGSVAVLDTPTEAIVSFVPDRFGSYLISLTANHTIRKTFIAAVCLELSAPFPPIRIRVPAIGETNEFPGGWAKTMKELMEIFVALLSNF
jgi:hypothetical protein